MTDARRWRALRKWLKDSRAATFRDVTEDSLMDVEARMYRHGEFAFASRVLREMTRLSRPQPPTRAPRGKEKR